MRASIILLALVGLAAITSAKLTRSQFEDSDAVLNQAETNLEEEDNYEAAVPGDGEEDGSPRGGKKLSAELEEGDGEEDGASRPTKKSKVLEEDEEYDLKEDDYVAEDRQMEEEKEREATVTSKIVKDASKVSQALEEAEDIDEEVKTAALDDVKMIKADAKEIRTASKARAANLKRAIKDRVEALKLMLHSQEEEAPAARVIADAAHVSAAVDASALSAKDKHEAKLVINRMTKNAKKFASASSKAVMAELKSEMRAELEELKSIMSDADETHNKSLEEDAVSRVEDDVKGVKQSLKSAKLSKAVKLDANKNLDAILRDAEEIPNASGNRRHNLEKAMKLRLAALREQLEGH